MVELALDWELVKWIVVYGVGILAIYFAGAIVASKKIMRQVAVVMHAYGEGFDELALALEDETVTEEEYEKVFKEFQEAYGESGKLYEMIKAAIPYQFLAKFFKFGPEE